MDGTDFVLTSAVLALFGLLVLAIYGSVRWVLSWTDQAQRERIELSEGRVLRRFQR